MDLLKLLTRGTVYECGIEDTYERAVSKLPSGFREEQLVPDPDGVLCLTYANVELHVFQGRVNNLVVKLAGMQAALTTDDGTSIPFDSSCSLDQIVSTLHALQVPWRVHSEHCLDQVIELITAGSASLEFVARGGHVRLNRIHVTEGESF